MLVEVFYERLRIFCMGNLLDLIFKFFKLDVKLFELNCFNIVLLLEVILCSFRWFFL